MFLKIFFSYGPLLSYSPLALSDDRLTKRNRQTYGFTSNEQTSSTEFRIILDYGQIPFILRCLQNTRVLSLTRFLRLVVALHKFQS